MVRQNIILKKVALKNYLGESKPAADFAGRNHDSTPLA